MLSKESLEGGVPSFRPHETPGGELMTYTLAIVAAREDNIPLAFRFDARKVTAFTVAVARCPNV